MIVAAGLSLLGGQETSNEMVLGAISCPRAYLSQFAWRFVGMDVLQPCVDIAAHPGTAFEILHDESGLAQAD